MTRNPLSLVCLLLLSGPALGERITPTGPASLTPSGPVTASANGQVIQNLDVTSTSGNDITVNGFSNVVIKNCKITHTGGAGIRATNADGLRIENVNVIHAGAPASGQNPSDDRNNIDVFSSDDVVVLNARLAKGSSGIYVLDSNRPSISFVEGYDFRGPFPRGQIVQLNKSHNGIIQDFYNQNPPATAWTEDNINIFQSDNAIVRRGLIDGNNSPSGVGVIIEPLESGNIKSLVEDVDTIRMGNGCFSSFRGDGNTFRRVRCRENICGDLSGRGTSLSNSLMFHSFAGQATNTRYEQAKYWASCNGNISWDNATMAVAEFEQVNYTQREPMTIIFSWEAGEV